MLYFCRLPPMMPPPIAKPPMFSNAMANMPSMTGNSIVTKAAFPAYSNVTISAPPTSNLMTSSKSVSVPTSASTYAQSTMIPTPPSATAASFSQANNTAANHYLQTTNATVRIMHPGHDLSLEELRARMPQYKDKIKGASMSPSNSVNVSTFS